MSDKSKICAIGEKKLIDGKWYEKALSVMVCQGCAWKREVGGSTTCEHPGGDTEEPVEEGGTECHSSIWIACDQPQPETPAVEECAGCRFWLERGADTAGDILGSCRRNPPQVYRDDYGDRFPLTWPHDWCGEWKA